jgi:uncharacterized protein (TIGR02996 family)
VAQGWLPDTPGRPFALAFDGILPDHPSPVPPPRHAPTEAELLQAIGEAPDDEAAALVYADWLLEQGDDNGERIALSCTAARRTLAPVEQARLEALDATRDQRWLGPVAAVTTQRHWSHGLLRGCSLVKWSVGTVAPAIGHRAWSSVTSVRALGAFLSAADVVALVAQPAMRGLRSLTLWPELAHAIEQLPAPPELPRIKQLRLAGELERGRLPSLRLPDVARLVLFTRATEPWVPSLFAAPFGAPLSSLVLAGLDEPLADWLALLDRQAHALTELRVTWRWSVFEDERPGTHLRVTRGDDGAWSALEVIVPPTGDATPPPELVAALAGLPSYALTRLDGPGELIAAEAQRQTRLRR